MSFEPLDLEEVLRTGKITRARVAELQAELTQGTRSSLGIQVVEIEEGVKALFKRGDVDPPGLLGVRREVAAYELAKLLAWEDLLPVVVTRQVPTEAGAAAEVAVIQLFVDRIENAPLDKFEGQAVARAGVFDAIIANPDRGVHNWLGVPEDGRFCLKLIDHELAFASPGGVSSAFWNAVGNVVPSHLRQTVSGLGGMVSDSPLRDLLPENEFQGLQERISSLRQTF